jgi:hypothetical protein
MVQLSTTRCSCITILWVGLVSFAAITLCVASQQVFIVVFHYWLSPETFGYPLVFCWEYNSYTDIRLWSELVIQNASHFPFWHQALFCVTDTNFHHSFQPCPHLPTHVAMSVCLFFYLILLPTHSQAAIAQVQESEWLWMVYWNNQVDMTHEVFRLTNKPHRINI